MNILDGVLTIDTELNDEMIESLITYLSDEEVKKIVIDTDNITSLALQQLFIASEEKYIECNNSFIEKFFEDLEVIGD